MSKGFISTKLMVMLICLTMLLPVLNLGSSNSNNTIRYLSEPNPDGLSTKALVPPPTLVSPPDGSMQTSSSITLSWIAMHGTISVNVQVDTTSSFSSPFVDIITLDNSQSLSSLDDDKYYWRARAQDGIGDWSDWSSTWDFTVDTTPPSAPTLVSPANGEKINDQTPDLVWNPPSTAEEYQVQVDDSVTFTSPDVDHLTSGISHTCITLSEGSWFWRVCARDAAGNWGSWSSIRHFEIDITPPGVPTLVSPTHNSYTNDNTPYFEWNSASGGFLYRIQIDTTSSFTSPDRDVTAGSTSYTPPTALSDNLYYWRVCAQDEAGNWGDWSTTWIVTIDTSPPGVPTLLSPINNDVINDPTPYLDWSSVSGASIYSIYVSETSDFSVPLYGYSTSSTSYTSLPLDEGIYYWHVRARDEAGNYGSWSATWKFTVDLTPPGEPALLSPADGSIDSDSTPYLDWSSVTSALLYQVQVATDSGFTSFEFDEVVGNTSLSSSILSEGVYYWRVRAQDQAGNWGAWSVVSNFEIDTTAPEITDVAFENTPTDLDVVFVYCNVTDSNGLDVVTLHYRVNSGAWTDVTMIWAIDNQYDVNLGTFAYDDFIEFYISAHDTCINPNIATDDNGGLYYSFTVVSGDVTGPTISSIAQNPDPANDLETITISCDVSDVNGIQSVTLYYRINSGSWTDVSMTFTSGSTYEVTIGPYDIADEIEYYIVAVDDSPNHNEATDDNSGAYYSFTIISSDVTGPTIDSIIQDPVFPDETQTVIISCSITDINGIQSASLYYRVNSGSWISTSMTNTAGSTYEATIPSFEFGDFIEYYIFAVDDYVTHNTATNNNGGLYYSFTVGASDVTGPIIDAIVHTPSSPSDAETVVISCSVMDSSGVQSVTLYYRINSGSWTDVSMTFTSGSTYEATIGLFAYNDFVEYYINATDAYEIPNTAINDNSGEYYTFTVVSGDTTVPTIDDVVFNPNTPSNNDQVNITCTVSDLNGIASVILHYRINGGSWVTTTMVLITGSQYKATVGPFATDSQIEFYITATDESPNSNVATDDNNGNYYSFTIETPTTSTPPTSNTSLALLIPFIGALLATIIIRTRKKQ